MKKFLSTLTAVTFFLFFFNSCANFDNSGTSLTLTFNGRDFIPADERNVTVPYTDTDTHVMVSLLGDVKKSRELIFNSIDERLHTTFNGIPVGASVYIMVNSFDPTRKDLTYFIGSGKSDRITISSGENYINVDMYNLKPLEGENYIVRNTFPCVNDNDEDDFSYKGNFDYNFAPDSYKLEFNISMGKYTLWSLSMSGGNFQPVSEGLAYIDNNKLYITECVYLNVICEEQGPNGSDVYPDSNACVIVESPREQVIPIEEIVDPSEPNSTYAFTFKSQNGLWFNFKMY